MTNISFNRSLHYKVQTYSWNRLTCLTQRGSSDINRDKGYSAVNLEALFWLDSHMYFLILYGNIDKCFGLLICIVFLKSEVAEAEHAYICTEIVTC